MKAVLFWLVVAAAFCVGMGVYMTAMPGDTFVGGLPTLTEDQSGVADRLSGHVAKLAGEIGTRGAHQVGSLTDARNYFDTQLNRAGYQVRDQAFDARGILVSNIEATRTGTRRPSDVIVIGAHYDSREGSPGANANASGCAVLLEVARELAAAPADRTIRFVLFANGAGPGAGDEKSGAAYYAREARKHGEKIVAMISIDSIGYYRDLPGSQSMPFPFGTLYPKMGNFVFFSGDLGSRELVRSSLFAFRKGTRFPSEGLAVPAFVPGFVSSDHLGFRTQGFPAIVVSDTGTLRYPQAGTAGDTADRLDFARMARVTTGLAQVVKSLAQSASLL